MRCSSNLIQFSLFTVLLAVNPATAEEIGDRSN
jgi:hypothetical protein